jgi:predicted small lipoprotein YifL
MLWSEEILAKVSIVELCVYRLMKPNTQPHSPSDWCKIIMKHPSLKRWGSLSWAVTCACFLSISMSACGQKGPLYLPNPKPAALQAFKSSSKLGPSTHAQGLRPGRLVKTHLAWHLELL